MPQNEMLGEDQTYLAMRISRLYLRTPGSSSLESVADGMVDDSCHNDSMTAVGAHSSYSNEVLVNGEIHILLHPTYQVPCPYIRIHDYSGRDVHVSEWEDAVGAIEEEHPFLGVPYKTIHPCGLPERMEIMRSAARGGPGDHVVQSEESPVDPLYLLKWFALTGPLICMPVSPNFYVAAQARLLQCDN